MTQPSFLLMSLWTAGGFLLFCSSWRQSRFEAWGLARKLALVMVCGPAVWAGLLWMCAWLVIKSRRNAEQAEAIVMELETRQERRERAIECWTLLEELREQEGHTVTLCCDNPDGPPDAAIQVCGDWTEWDEVRIEGQTVLECLQKAVRAKRAFDDHERQQWNNPNA